MDKETHKMYAKCLSFLQDRKSFEDRSVYNVLSEVIVFAKSKLERRKLVKFL